MKWGTPERERGGVNVGGEGIGVKTKVAGREITILVLITKSFS